MIIPDCDTCHGTGKILLWGGRQRDGQLIETQCPDCEKSLMKETTLKIILKKKEALGDKAKIEIRHPNICLLMTRDGYIMEELKITEKERQVLIEKDLVEENDYSVTSDNHITKHIFKSI